MTFEEWKSSKVWNMRAEHILNPDLGISGAPGFEYSDGSVILMSYTKPGTWYTVVGRSEIEDLDLDVVEQFLWNEHSMYNFEPHKPNINEEEEQLTTGFKLFCEQNGLKHESMDEVHARLIIQRDNKEGELRVVKTQLQECNDWMDKWIAMTERQKGQLGK